MNEYGGPERSRRVLSSTLYSSYVFVPIFLLHYLASRHPSTINTLIKQAIALPLMVSLVAVPYLCRDPQDGLFCIMCQVISFSTFQRFSDIFWIRPLIYKSDAYISTAELKGEFWSCVRKITKDNHERKEGKTFKKVRPFYYLLPFIAIHLIVSDIFAAYLKTFTANDILYLQEYDKFRYFIVFLSGVTFMTALFNFCGQMLQLGYAITVGQGYYAPDEWTLMMNYPILGNSLEDIWSKRWHRVFKIAWVSCAFRPVYFIIRQKTRNAANFKYVALGMATLAVFLASGVLHEYIVLCNAGWTIYIEKYAGQQLVFFSIHGVLVVMEKVLEQKLKQSIPRSIRYTLLVRLLCHIYTIAIAFITLPWFLTSFSPWGFNKLPIFTPIGDKVTKLLSVDSFLQKYCGSQLQ